MFDVGSGACEPPTPVHIRSATALGELHPLTGDLGVEVAALWGGLLWGGLLWGGLLWGGLLLGGLGQVVTRSPALERVLAHMVGTRTLR